VFKLALEIRDRRRTKIATGPLNKIMEGLILKHPPAGPQKKSPTQALTTQPQTGTETTIFTLFGSHAGVLHFGYRRYLKTASVTIDFIGTPIRLNIGTNVQTQSLMRVC